MANDTLPYAKEVYEANHPKTDYRLGDVQKIKIFPSADLLVGCYPCQGFSQGGVRDPSRRINTLALRIRQGACSDEAESLHQLKMFQAWCARTIAEYLLLDQIKVFSEIGYNVRYAVLNAADFGVAQERKRILIVGTRSDLGAEFLFPEPTHGIDRPLAHTTIKEALRYGFRNWPSEDEYYRRDFHWYYLSRDRRRGWSDVSKTIVANPRHMPLHPISPPLRKLSHNVWEFEHNGRQEGSPTARRRDSRVSTLTSRSLTQKREALTCATRWLATLYLRLFLPPLSRRSQSQFGRGLSR